MPGGAPAHHDDTPDMSGDRRVVVQRRCEVGQGSDGADDDLSRGGGAAFAQEGGGAACIGAAGRCRRGKVAEPFWPVNEIGGRGGIALAWYRAATGDRHRLASHVGEIQRVSCRLRGCDIAEHGRQADDVEARIGKGQMDGHRIVNSRIRVDNDLLCHE